MYLKDFCVFDDGRFNSTTAIIDMTDDFLLWILVYHEFCPFCIVFIYYYYYYYWAMWLKKKRLAKS